MQITHHGQTHDFEKWSKWRRLDTTLELLELDGETILDYQREGSSLYLFIEGGAVHEQSTEQSTAVGLLVLEFVGISAETFGDEPGPPAPHFELAYLTGSIPTLLQMEPGKYKKLLSRFRFEVDASYSGGADLREAVLWDFSAKQVTAYWKER
jgi:hypothetical protein